MRDPRIHYYYRPEMVVRAEIGKFGAQSPEKPRLLKDHLARHDLLDSFVIRGDFEPLDRDDLLLAHTPLYVDAFLAGEPPLCSSNRLPSGGRCRSAWRSSADTGPIITTPSWPCTPPIS